MKNTKKFAPTKRAAKNMEIIANDPVIGAQAREMKLYLDGNVEYMIIKKSPQTHKLVRHATVKTETAATKEVNKLAKQGIKALFIPKTITNNQYKGLYLLDDGHGNVEFYNGLEAVLDLLSIREKENMKLRKTRTRKTYAEGTMAFAYNSKTNSYVCTRLYTSEDVARHYINKRNNISPETVITAPAVKQYDGYHFKDERLDEHTRLRDIKAALLERK